MHQNPTFLNTSLFWISVNIIVTSPYLPPLGNPDVALVALCPYRSMFQASNPGDLALKLACFGLQQTEATWRNTQPSLKKKPKTSWGSALSGINKTNFGDSLVNHVDPIFKSEFTAQTAHPQMLWKLDFVSPKSQIWNVLEPVLSLKKLGLCYWRIHIL